MNRVQSALRTDIIGPKQTLAANVIQVEIYLKFWELILMLIIIKHILIYVEPIKLL